MSCVVPPASASSIRTEIRRTHYSASPRWVLLILQTPQNKKADNKSHLLFYGASDGINFELYCVEFLHLCLHDEDTIEQIKSFLYNKDIKDY